MNYSFRLWGFKRGSFGWIPAFLVAGSDTQSKPYEANHENVSFCKLRMVAHLAYWSYPCGMQGDGSIPVLVAQGRGGLKLYAVTE